ncbi:MAG: glutamate--tRNA ligase [Bacillota bacterium]|nr:glutamate--tRNA ligase [Bacillota bacterium]
MDYKKLADLLLPEINSDVTEIENKYPDRGLDSNAIVTRFAPSPTGFVHLGSLFASMVAMRLARQTNGVFYLRIEDTDKKREVEGGITKIVNALSKFGIYFDEGFDKDGNEFGNYGPYLQSKREEIYKSYIKSLIEKGLAYPCFCSPEEIEKQKEEQTAKDLRVGYYGTWAKCRNLSMEDIEKNIKEGKEFIIRLKSEGDIEKFIELNDLIRGNLSLPENDQDIVLMKTNGLPTYHFAHVIDDHLMKTTHVIRGEEWLPSASLHLQLFNIMGFKAPLYAHISTIRKQDGPSKRKLSKRKDPELSMEFYEKEGYPIQTVIEYLTNLANSSFEDWRKNNPLAPLEDYNIRLDNMSVSGPLFDIVKLEDISKTIIANMNTDEVFNLYNTWAKSFDADFAKIIEDNKEYYYNIFSIERGGVKPRKDFSKWSEVKNYISYFNDELFAENLVSGYIFDNLDTRREDIINTLQNYLSLYNENDNNEEWFDKIKVITDKIGYTKDMKQYKKNPGNFKGSIADVATFIRITMTNRKNTPDLHRIMIVMGKERVEKRIHMALEFLNKMQ